MTWTRQYGEILAIYVEPAHWGDGTARALCTADRDWAARRAAGRRPAVGAGRQRPRPRFYERAGLSADGERSRYPVPLAGGGPPVHLDELRYTGRLRG